MRDRWNCHSGVEVLEARYPEQNETRGERDWLNWLVHDAGREGVRDWMDVQTMLSE